MPVLVWVRPELMFHGESRFSPGVGVMPVPYQPKKQR